MKDQLEEKTEKAHQRGKEMKKRKVILLLVLGTNVQVDWDAINQKRDTVLKTATESDEMKVD